MAILLHRKPCWCGRKRHIRMGCPHCYQHLAQNVQLLPHPQGQPLKVLDFPSCFNVSSSLSGSTIVELLQWKNLSVAKRLHISTLSEQSVHVTVSPTLFSGAPDTCLWSHKVVSLGAWGLHQVTHTGIFSNNTIRLCTIQCIIFMQNSMNQAILKYLYSVKSSSP